jgi:hypothetical protein
MIVTQLVNKYPVLNVTNMPSYPRWPGCSVLATGRGFKHSREIWDFLRAIKIRSTTSFEGEVKQSVPPPRFMAS